MGKAKVPSNISALIVSFFLFYTVRTCFVEYTYIERRGQLSYVQWDKSYAKSENCD